MSWSVVHHPTPAALLERAREALLEDEARSSLILGIVEGLPSDATTTMLMTVEREGRVDTVALRTPGHKLLLTDGSPEAIDALCEDLRRRRPDLPGVTGPTAATERFAHGFGDAEPTLHMRLHRLDRVAEVPQPPGHVRVATPSDAAVLEPWAQGFVDESGSDDPRPGAELLAPYLRQGSLYLWIDEGEPRCMAGWSRGTANGASISMVYTPARSRGRGYATALVARLSSEILARGKRFCVLFTNLANPTANAIYARIGYQPVCDYESWSFTGP